MSGFQTSVNANPAPAVEGDFASANPWFSQIAGPGQIVAGANGVTIGRFAWLDPTGTAASNVGFGGTPSGFVGRAGHPGMITEYLQIASMVVPAGFPVTLYAGGDFWARTSTVAQIGQKVYANYADGSISTGATGTPPAGATTTASIAAHPGNVTASIADNVMTVTVVNSGAIRPGSILSGSGVTSGTRVTAQLTGTDGGLGTYLVTPTQTVASTTIAATAGLLTVTVLGSGTLAVGQVLSGSGVTAGTYITGLGTGVGGIGTYYVTPSQTASSTAIAATGGVETSWYVNSNAGAGELVKITRTTPPQA